MAIPESENGDFISGIYNYCDRWCERCSMTIKCRQYAMECARDAFNADGSQEGDSYEFMESLLNLPDDTEKDEQEAEVPDFEPASETSEEIDELDFLEYMQQQEEIDRQTQDTICVKLADRYMSEGTRWLDEWDSLVSEQDDDEQNSLANAVDIINWYLFQMPTKLRRAVNGKISREEYMQFDVHGSAKVVLIGAESSLDAWRNLQSFLPEDRQDAVAPILAILKDMIIEIDLEIPQAREFKRPGFDD